LVRQRSRVQIPAKAFFFGQKEKESLPYPRHQLVDDINSCGCNQNLIKKATYFVLIESKSIKRKDNNTTRGKSETSPAYYTLTNQGKTILKVAEIMGYTAEDVKDPMNQEQTLTQTGEQKWMTFLTLCRV
jgi:CRISPR/Cas system CSM-associated protein Csm4 (group 5 of RAMP superfamily)